MQASWICNTRYHSDVVGQITSNSVANGYGCCYIFARHNKQIHRPKRQMRNERLCLLLSRCACTDDGCPEEARPTCTSDIVPILCLWSRWASLLTVVKTNCNMVHNDDMHVPDVGHDVRLWSCIASLNLIVQLLDMWHFTVHGKIFSPCLPVVSSSVRV